MIILSLTGRASSGKSEAAKYLRTQYELSEIAFADPLKNALAAMLGMSRDVFDTLYQGAAKEQALQPFGKSPRQMMQTLGTEWGRDLIHPEFWTMLTRGRIEKIEHSVGDILPGIVISDVRFANEAAYARSVGSLIHIERNNIADVNQHSSENGIATLPTDFHIDNNGTLSDLHAQLDALVAHLIYNKRATA